MIYMRGKPAPRRKIQPDIKYNSTIVAKFINYIMRKGKKSTAQAVVYGCFDIIDQRLKKGIEGINEKQAIEVFDKAIRNISPTVEVVGRRVGGANYQVPVPVKGDRRLALAFRWLIGAADKKKGRPMAEKLASELIDSYLEQGDAIKKKQDVYKMAESNRAFAHFAR